MFAEVFEKYEEMWTNLDILSVILLADRQHAGAPPFSRCDSESKNRMVVLPTLCDIGPLGYDGLQSSKCLKKVQRKDCPNSRTR